MIMSEYQERIKTEINKIETTNDTINVRGGLLFITKYLKKINLLSLLSDAFSFFRKSKKGRPLPNIFKQIICFFIDGTSFTLSYFDEIKEDSGYAAVIEEEKKELQSSHSINRFFNKFTKKSIYLFRKIFLTLFIWCLTIEKP